MDINIFENGWDRNNAYIFGWVMSDGCLLKEGRNKTAYAVRICSKDDSMIHWLHEHLCIGNKIYNCNGAFLIKYRNAESIQFMMQNCLKERKSLDLQYPDIPNAFFPDFLRGYFDGNGSVVLRRTKYNTYGQASITSGSKDFLLGLQEQLNCTGIESRLYADGRETNKAMYLRVIKRSELEKLFQLMYGDLNGQGYLGRKFEKFLELMQAEPKYKSHIA